MCARAAFLRHLTICHRWIEGLEADGHTLGTLPSHARPHLGRPDSSNAKLIDERLCARITGGAPT
jgi:hypothetical protein